MLLAEAIGPAGHVTGLELIPQEIRQYFVLFLLPSLINRYTIYAIASSWKFARIRLFVGVTLIINLLVEAVYEAELISHTDYYQYI